MQLAGQALRVGVQDGFEFETRRTDLRQKSLVEGR